jgi:hypothetical protein
MTEFYTLRPGLLVGMSTSLHGNVKYQVEEIKAASVTARGTLESEWNTRKIVIDPAEHDDAIKMRTKIRGLILSVCSRSEFGLLCPNNRQDELREAIAEARTLTEKFNAGAKTTHIKFNVICGRIAQDDVETVRAITGEVRSLMEAMQDGVKSLDVKVIRDAANKAKQVGEMLSPDAAKRLEVAITVARESARKIARAGDVAANEIDRAAIRKIAKARTSFLDINTEVATMVEPQVKGRNMDLGSIEVKPDDLRPSGVRRNRKIDL